MKTINNKLIRSFDPCYDPLEMGIPENETLPVLEWVEKYRETVPAKDIIWLLCHNEFLSDKDLRLFAVWCAREALNLIENPDARSIEACNVAERFANGDATMGELEDSWNAAWAAYAAAGDAALVAARAALDAAWNAAWDASAAARSAAWAASASWDARAAAGDAAMEARLNKLLNYFK